MSFRHTKACFQQKTDMKVQICYLQAHTKVFPYITSYRGKFLKRVLTYLCCTKCNEINICHLYIHKHVSHKK